jgi:hypothetical protein
LLDRVCAGVRVRARACHLPSRSIHTKTRPRVYGEIRSAGANLFALVFARA